jgi:hypothetical protein
MAAGPASIGAPAILATGGTAIENLASREATSEAAANNATGDVVDLHATGVEPARITALPDGSSRAPSHTQGEREQRPPPTSQPLHARPLPASRGVHGAEAVPADSVSRQKWLAVGPEPARQLRPRGTTANAVARDYFLGPPLPNFDGLAAICRWRGYCGRSHNEPCSDERGCERPCWPWEPSLWLQHCQPHRGRGPRRGGLVPVAAMPPNVAPVARAVVTVVLPVVEALGGAPGPAVVPTAPVGSA